MPKEAELKTNIKTKKHLLCGVGGVYICTECRYWDECQGKYLEKETQKQNA